MTFDHSHYFIQSAFSDTLDLGYIFTQLVEVDFCGVYVVFSCLIYF